MNSIIYQFFFILILILNPTHTWSMKRFATTNFHENNTSQCQPEAIKILDIWLYMANKLINQNYSIEQNSDNEEHSDYQHLLHDLELYWDQQLIIHGVYTSDFKAMLKKEYNDSNQYLKVLDQKDCCSLGELLKEIIRIIANDFGLKTSIEDCVKLIKHVIIISVLQNFLKIDEQLSWCSCDRVTVGERIVMLISTIEKVCENCSVLDCAVMKPLVYTSFGSGLLLYDYIIISILHNLGYNYLNLNFVDPMYDNNKYRGFKKCIRKGIEYQLNHYDGKFNITFFNSSDEYLNNSSEVNHIISTIDTIHHNDAKSDFKNLINKIADKNTVIGILANHKIKYKAVRH